MQRGLPEAPRWAWTVIALSLAWLVVGGVLLANRPGPPAFAALPAPSETPAPTGPQPVPMTRPADGPLRALLVGDSLTNGLFASEQTNGFAFQLVARLEQSGPVEREQAAVSGGGTGQVSVVTDVPGDLNLAVVELGTNDAGRTDIDLFAEQYAALLDRIREGSPTAALICLGTWGDAPQYDAQVQTACEAHSGRYVALRGLYADANLRGPAGEERFGGESDDFHPNDAGHTAIADLVWGQLSVVPAA